MSRHFRVFVDCDRTLVNTDLKNVISPPLFDKRTKFITQGKLVLTEARPSAMQFMEALNQKYDVSILTLGHSKFQAKVLGALGMMHLIQSIYGPDNWQELTKPDGFVLIDDMSADSIGIAYKMRWLGRQRSLENLESWDTLVNFHLIQCVPFCGGKLDVGPLTEHLDIVHKRMEEQMAVVE
jgi:NLI interacting factor-like phosphatase.